MPFNTDHAITLGTVRHLQQHSGLDCHHKVPWRDECPQCDAEDAERQRGNVEQANTIPSSDAT
jgi:hypothetical protein